MILNFLEWATYAIAYGLTIVVSILTISYVIGRFKRRKRDGLDEK